MRFKRPGIWLTFAWLLATSPMGASAEGLSNVPHQVLAFYYGWYLQPDWAKTARWTPSDGSYNSMEPAVIERQVAQAKQAGITGLIASWWPERGGYTDAQLPLLLQAAGRHGMTVSVIVEGFGPKTAPKKTPEMVTSDLDYIFSRYGADPAWLRVGGRPVVFLYGRATHELPSAEVWNQVLAAVRSAHRGAIVLSDGQGALQTNRQATAGFDGLFSYGITSRTHGKTPLEIEASLRKLDAQFVAQTPRGDVACLVVAPGYDDTQTTRPRPRPVTDRFDGMTYRATWEAALAAKPDWVLISTFNEWIEGTQIEPSKEFGTKALADTELFSKRFMASPRRP